MKKQPQQDLLRKIKPLSQLDTSESSTEPTNTNSGKKFAKAQANESSTDSRSTPVNKLIVNFPPSRLDHACTSERRVQFSATSSMIPVKYTRKEAWYPEWSESYFKQRVMYHARDMYQQYGNRPNDGLLKIPALALRYLGMEPQIFQDLLQCKRGQRKNHILRVLQLQSTCSPERLRELSEESSESARARATELGETYAELQLD